MYCVRFGYTGCYVTIFFCYILGYIGISVYYINCYVTCYTKYCVGVLKNYTIVTSLGTASMGVASATCTSGRKIRVGIPARPPVRVVTKASLRPGPRLGSCHDDHDFQVAGSARAAAQPGLKLHWPGTASRVLARANATRPRAATPAVTQAPALCQWCGYRTTG